MEGTEVWSEIFAWLRTRTSCEVDSGDLCPWLEGVGELEGHAGQGDFARGGDERVRAGAGGGADRVYRLLLRGEEEQGGDRGGSW